MKSLKLLFLLLVSVSAIAQDSRPRFVFIGDFILPDKIDGLKEPFGGLSGISYDAKTKTLMAVSDDRAILGPVRAYRLPLGFGSKRNPAALPDVSTQNIKPLYLKDLKGFPFAKLSVDYEGIAYNSDGTLYVSSEGNQRFFAKTAPSISAFNPDGKELFQLPMPEMFWNSKNSDYGVKGNRAFEGLTLNSTGDLLYAATEGPLSQEENTHLVRIQEFNLKERKATRQFTYPIETVGDNGISEILSVADKKFFVLERQYIAEKDKVVAKVFEANCEKADDSQPFFSLASHKITSCSKKMVLDLDSVLPQIKGNYKKIDNLEGMSFGPDLPGGGRWFFLISDNNFNRRQRTQILAFHWFPY